MKNPIPILKILDECYPFDGVCFLHYQEPWQLLFATIMSAQCTDDRVNQVTAVLFRDYPTLQSFAEASLPDLEKAIHSTGFYRMKAKHIKESAHTLLVEYKGQLPSDIGLLTALPGVGRKTANVVRSHIFKLPSIVVDTHVMRVSRKLGLAQQKDPVKIEYELMEILPKDHWIRYNQQVISHGRAVCAARSPRCHECQLSGECDTCLKK